jgi:hypothetical protein
VFSSVEIGFTTLRPISISLAVYEISVQERAELGRGNMRYTQHKISPAAPPAAPECRDVAESLSLKFRAGKRVGENFSTWHFLSQLPLQQRVCFILK